MTSQIEVNPQTIRNTLYKAGYHGRNARRKPFISSVNKQKRLEFAKNHLNEPETFWENVVFSDESKYKIFGSDGVQKVWRKVNTELDAKNLTPTVKHAGASVMVWGCMSASGVGNLVFINENMTKDVYLNILKQNLVPSVEKLGLDKNRFMFQQDNDPKHTI